MIWKWWERDKSISEWSNELWLKSWPQTAVNSKYGFYTHSVIWQFLAPDSYLNTVIPRLLAYEPDKWYSMNESLWAYRSLVPTNLAWHRRTQPQRWVNHSCQSPLYQELSISAGSASTPGPVQRGSAPFHSSRLDSPPPLAVSFLTKFLAPARDLPASEVCAAALSGSWQEHRTGPTRGCGGCFYGLWFHEAPSIPTAHRGGCSG